MRHPLWLLNSALLILLLIALLASMLTQEKPPRWIGIEPMPYATAIKKDVSKIDISKIYTNDLFDTYRKPAISEEKRPLELQLPPPPSPIQTSYVPPAPPSFLEPLPLILKGIIILGNDQKNRALVEDTKTKEERAIKMGDTIEDAILVSIFRNRIILVRSNGQEETLYLREGDAKASRLVQSAERWDGILKQRDDMSVVIDPEAFKETVPTVGQLIDMLNLTTVYRQGKPVGARLGAMEPGSLGLSLGLMMGDIITMINTLPVTDQASRMKIYKTITQLPLDSTINVTIQRGTTPLILTIKLEELGRPLILKERGLVDGKKPQLPAKTMQDIEEEKIKLLGQKHMFAPTLDELRRREKRTMLTKVKKTEHERRAQQRPTRFEI